MTKLFDSGSNSKVSASGSGPGDAAAQQPGPTTDPANAQQHDGGRRDATGRWRRHAEHAGQHAGHAGRHDDAAAHGPTAAAVQHDAAAATTTTATAAGSVA